MLSFATEDIRSWAEPIFNNNEKYCNKHGYDWVEHWKLKDESRPASWSKIPYILEELNNNYDWVFWIDADALVMDDTVKLEEFIDDRFDFVITKDEASWNAGVFFTQNTELAIDLLDYTYSREEFINHPKWEQAAFINACLERPSRVKVIDSSKGEKGFNSVAQVLCDYWDNDICSYEAGAFTATYDLKTCKKSEYKDGDFILHLSGFNDEGRLSLLKKFRPDLFD
jgi:hypothetical protein